MGTTDGYSLFAQFGFPNFLKEGNLTIKDYSVSGYYSGFREDGAPIAGGQTWEVVRGFEKI